MRSMVSCDVLNEDFRRLIIETCGNSALEGGIVTAMLALVIAAEVLPSPGSPSPHGEDFELG
jgi:hypothetical protein